MGNPHMANSSQSLTPEARDLARLFGPGVHRARLTDGAEAAGDPPAGARVVDDSPCPPGHNTPLPLKRSPPASFKRLLGARSQVMTRCHQRSARLCGPRSLELPAYLCLISRHLATKSRPQRGPERRQLVGVSCRQGLDESSASG